MRLTRLALTNFRNHTRLDLPLPAGPILLYGANAQGKTTLLEAIYYLATSKSPHASNDRQLLNWYANQAEKPLAVGRLTAVVQPAGDTRPRNLEIRLIREQNGRRNDPSFRREVLVNGVKVRMMDLLGNLNVVLFLPEDVALVSAPPAERRRYLNITLCQVDRHYCNTLSQYNRVLSQRNALLRTLQEQRRPATASAQLDPWDQKLAKLGAVIVLRRVALITELEQRAGQIHFHDLTGEAESLRLIYQPRLRPNNNFSLAPPEGGAPDTRPGSANSIAPGTLHPPKNSTDPAGWLLQRSEDELAIALRDILQTSRQLELQRGATLVGPHRDDLRFLVNGRDLAEYGSRGQQRTTVLALKLAEVAWMEKQTGERPLLLLDEVLAELDQTRRAYLLHCIGTAEQAVLTATDPSMFTDEFLAQATQMEVADGQVITRLFKPES